MELQFAVNPIPCLRQLKSEQQSQEQTQEVRLNDTMPDVGRILGTWGQVVIRGKEWRGDEIAVSGGVIVWVLYAPEDGTAPQKLECWIPMQMRWEIPPTDQDGRILCNSVLKSVDARVLSGRKIMVRATVEMLGQAYAPYEVRSYTPADVPSDIQLLQRKYPICLMREIGEKAFVMDEELNLPATAPTMESIVRFGIYPEVSDQKVMADKAIFRGSTVLHILYQTTDGALASWDFEIPFSQYTELQQEYGSMAQVQIVPMITSMELELGEQGRLQLKAGLSGQYVIYDTQEMNVVEDGYSTERKLQFSEESMAVPCVLERQSQKISAEQTVNGGYTRVVDIMFSPGNIRKQQRSEEISVEIPGSFQVLGYDREGVLQSGSAHWQWEWNENMQADCSLDLWCYAGGKNQATPGETETAVRGELLVQTAVLAEQSMPMITGLIVGEKMEKDPQRPSLILQRTGDMELWQIAKKCGSSVEAICQANGLQGEPDPEKILLIPVL